jgi:tetratricopeptide (TPR) repeat protein
MWSILVLSMLAAVIPVQTSRLLRSGITIVSTGKDPGYGITNYDVGPEGAGGIVNNHYFPAIRQYNGGSYSEAEANLSYLVERPNYIPDVNPRKAQFISNAYYLRGTIYFYHAVGVGRQTLAKSDFEAAIKWNPNNSLAYLELSRVYSSLEIYDQAISIIEHLLERKPEQEVAEHAKADLEKLKSISN